VESSFLLLPRSLVRWKHPALSAECPLQLLICYSVFLFVEWGGGSVCPGAMLVYPRGGCGSTSWRLFAHLLVCVSQAGLKPVSGGKGALRFLSVTWCGEALCQLGLGVSEFCLFLVPFFLPSVAPASQQDIWFMDLTLSASFPLVVLLDLLETI
jgi:hypothetical protein